MKKLLSIGLLLTLSTGVMACESIKYFKTKTDKTTQRFYKLVDKVQNSENEDMVYDIQEQMEILTNTRILEVDHVSKSHINEKGGKELYQQLKTEALDFMRYRVKLNEVINKTLK